MKPVLRILVILISIAIVVIALLPPKKTEEPQTASTPEASAVPEKKTAPNSQKLIRDILGGAAIDSGKQAKEKISGVNQKREQDFEELGL
ncbi:hypothetical protein P0Y35_09405 [Kiritimatiellaeota bacterium B1221]|nr:hypothetical protein [Kiritimatiellaeota bacterium B1221]